MHKLVGFACVVAVSLAGCATSAQFGPAVETFKALFSKPADVTLTAEELANYPYAAQYALLKTRARPLFWRSSRAASIITPALKVV